MALSCRRFSISLLIALLVGFFLGQSTSVTVQPHQPLTGAAQPYWVAGVRLLDTGQNVTRLFNQTGKRYHIAPYDLVAVALNESALHQTADRYGVPPDVSHGLVQFTDQTAIGLGVCRDDASCRAWLDVPANSIRLEGQFLAGVIRQSCEPFPKAYAAYNQGAGYGCRAPEYEYPQGQAYANYQHFLTNREYALEHYIWHGRNLGASIVGNGYPLLDNVWVQEKLWHLPCISAVIESAYSYEINLLDGSPPVADQDNETCGTPGYQVVLPGGAQDGYGWAGTYKISGSGYVVELVTPNGGRLSLLHLEAVYTPVSARVDAAPPTLPQGVDDATGLALGAASLPPPRLGAAVFHGGEVIGLSGYPTDPIYGNGSVGAGNSQLCVLSDQAAQNWLLWLAEGYDNPPNPSPKPHNTPHFPLKKWGHAVSAYHRGKLKPEARFWWHHAQKYGAPSGKERWFPRSKKRRFGYERLPLRKPWVIYYWPARPKWKKVARR